MGMIGFALGAFALVGLLWWMFVVSANISTRK
jgi:hypothetical protein